MTRRAEPPDCGLSGLMPTPAELANATAVAALIREDSLRPIDLPLLCSGALIRIPHEWHTWRDPLDRKAACAGYDPTALAVADAVLGVPASPKEQEQDAVIGRWTPAGNPEKFGPTPKEQERA